MSRDVGTFNFSANYELLVKGHWIQEWLLKQSDLTSSFQWDQGDGNVWLYDGAIVTVTKDQNHLIMGYITFQVLSTMKPHQIGLNQERERDLEILYYDTENICF